MISLLFGARHSPNQNKSVLRRSNEATLKEMERDMMALLSQC
jgi:hypothetical protein